LIFGLNLSAVDNSIASSRPSTASKYSSLTQINFLEKKWHTYKGEKARLHLLQKFFEVRLKYEWSTSEVQVKFGLSIVKYGWSTHSWSLAFSPLGIIVGFSDSINHEETRKITDQSIAFKYFFLSRTVFALKLI
jgi:hypothetical protein